MLHPHLAYWPRRALRAERESFFFKLEQASADLAAQYFRSALAAFRLRLQLSSMCSLVPCAHAAIAPQRDTSSQCCTHLQTSIMRLTLRFLRIKIQRRVVQPPSFVLGRTSNPQSSTLVRRTICRSAVGGRGSAATNQDILDSRACSCNNREIAEVIAPLL